MFSSITDRLAGRAGVDGDVGAAAASHHSGESDQDAGETRSEVSECGEREEDGRGGEMGGTERARVVPVCMNTSVIVSSCRYTVQMYKNQTVGCCFEQSDGGVEIVDWMALLTFHDPPSPHSPACETPVHPTF